MLDIVGEFQEVILGFSRETHLSIYMPICLSAGNQGIVDVAS